MTSNLPRWVPRAPIYAARASLVVITVLAIVANSGGIAFADQPPGVNFKIDFKAAGALTYDHSTGVGGAYGTGLPPGAVNSLAGADFECGDKVVFFAAIAANDKVVGTHTAELEFSFSAEPTGQPGAGFTDLVSAGANPGDPGHLVNGNEGVSIISESLGTEELTATVRVSNLEAGEQFVLRLVVLLECVSGEEPTGGLQAALESASLAGGLGKIPGGNQTIPVNLPKPVAPPPPPLPGEITIVKDAVPDDAADFAFTGDLGGFSLDDDSDPALPNSQTFPGLAAGSYHVFESPVADWDLTSIVCVDPDGGSSVNLASRKATIDLDPGESVICTFVNTKVAPPPPPPPGSITIVKDAVPDDPADFAFTGDLGGFSLDDDSDPALPSSQTFPGLAGGSYHVFESVGADWDLTSIVCVDPDGGSGVTLASREATIDLDPGESVICTFVNTKVLPPAQVGGGGQAQPGPRPTAVLGEKLVRGAAVAAAQVEAGQKLPMTGAPHLVLLLTAALACLAAGALILVATKPRPALVRATSRPPRPARAQGRGAPRPHRFLLARTGRGPPPRAGPRLAETLGGRARRLPWARVKVPVGARAPSEPG